MGFDLSSPDLTPTRDAHQGSSSTNAPGGGIQSRQLINCLWLTSIRLGDLDTDPSTAELIDQPLQTQANRLGAVSHRPPGDEDVHFFYEPVIDARNKLRHT